MRHIPLDTLYPWLELTCQVCGEDSDHPVESVDYEHPWNSVFDDPICHCGHRFDRLEVRWEATIYY